jgi:ATP-dependent Clp protease ATP-binding subunit ClpC
MENQKTPYRADTSWVVAAAMYHCAQRGIKEAEGPVVLLSLLQLRDSALVALFSNLLGDAGRLKGLIDTFHALMLRKASNLKLSGEDVQFSEGLKLVLKRAVCEAQGLEDIAPDGSNISTDPAKAVTPAHLFMGLMVADPQVAKVLREQFKIVYNDVVRRQILAFQRRTDQKASPGLRDAMDTELRREMDDFDPDNVPEAQDESQKPGLWRAVAQGQPESSADFAGKGAAAAGKPESRALIVPVTVKKAGRNRLASDSALMKYGVDLTAKAERDGGKNPIIGRENDVNRVIQVLMRRGKKNAALIGEPGVGKTAIVQALARRIVDGAVPEMLKDAVIISLDMGDAVGGTRYRGDFEERLKQVLKELSEHPEVILFIDEMHTLIGTGKGSDGSGSAAQLMKTSLGDGSIKCIGATTLDEYKNYIEKDQALNRRFLPVFVDEPSEEDTLEILEGLRPFYEEFHRLTIQDDALAAAVDIAARFLKTQGRTLPDAPIDLIDSTCAFLRFQAELGLTPEGEALARELIQLRRSIKKAERNQLKELAQELQERARKLEEQLAPEKQRIKPAAKDLIVTAEDVRKTASFWSRIPLDKMNANERRMLLDLEMLLKKVVFGQDAVIDEIAPAVRAARALKKLKEILPPSFLFSGPTGSGKTLLARMLADILGIPLIRLDMSEYKEQHTVSTLIGAPPGYKDGDVNGTLTEPVRRNPYCVLLLDEIEKAHRDVDDLLLQIQDNGFLHDRQGRKVDFRHVILIATCNVGSKHQDAVFSVDGIISEPESADESFREAEQRVKGDLKRVFRPEFLNRFTALPVFRIHTPEVVRKILAHLVGEEMKVYLAEWDIELTLDDSALALLNSTVTGMFNARPVKRKIQKLVRDILVRDVLGEIFKPGDQLVGSAAAGKRKQIVFKKVEKAAS